MNLLAALLFVLSAGPVFASANHDESEDILAPGGETITVPAHLHVEDGPSRAIYDEAKTRYQVVHAAPEADLVFFVKVEESWPALDGEYARLSDQAQNINQGFDDLDMAGQMSRLAEKEKTWRKHTGEFEAELARAEKYCKRTVSPEEYPSLARECAQLQEKLKAAAAVLDQEAAELNQNADDVKVRFNGLVVRHNECVTAIENWNERGRKFILLAKRAMDNGGSEKCDAEKLRSLQYTLVTSCLPEKSSCDSFDVAPRDCDTLRVRSGRIQECVQAMETLKSDCGITAITPALLQDAQNRSEICSLRLQTECKE